MRNFAKKLAIAFGLAGVSTLSFADSYLPAATTGMFTQLETDFGTIAAAGGTLLVLTTAVMIGYSWVKRVTKKAA